MFERYTEEARRVIFFARYEASRFGSTTISTEHLLLGLLREDKALRARLPIEAREQMREQIAQRAPRGTEHLSISVDLPLSHNAKRALAYANEDCAALQHTFIDAGHLVLGLLRLENSAEASLLRQHGIDYLTYRDIVSQLPLRGAPPTGHRPQADRIRAVERLSAWSERETAAPAAPSLQTAITKLAALVDSTIQHIHAYADDYGDQRLKRTPWTRKEALGHLIDWATTHQQWLARALTSPTLVTSGYPHKEWVPAQHYETFAWQELVDLWVSLNRLLVHVLAHIPETKVHMPCRIGIDEPMPLSKLIVRYVSHCEDIIGQILAHL